MRVLVIVGVVVFVAAFLGAWIAIMLMARRASNARAARDRAAWRVDDRDRDDTTPRGPGAAAWMPLGVAGALGAAAASDATTEQATRRAEQGGDGPMMVDPGVSSDDDRDLTRDLDANPADDGGGWGGDDGGGGGDGGGDGGGGD
ncbi:MAG: hypothetical protein WCK33_00235 [Phycisphaerae bacterium]